MTWSSPRTFLQVSVNDVVVRTTSDISISESLESTCRTAEFVMASQPEPHPAQGDTVLIEFVDGDADLVYALFGGTINTLETESEPWSHSILCCDQLEKLRATNKSGDMDLSGMTDGEAWKAIADYCGVTYDDGDISDAGYVLGSQEPLAWHDDASTAGSAVIQELDSVFGMVTMTIEDNRVIRIPVDWTPTDDIGLYRSYTKGSDADWDAHHRSRGNRDSIQNVWSVTGAAVESSDGACTATPWAFAVSGNAQIGRRTRTATQTFSSDFIQDESLAVAIIERLMKRTNRSPDKSSITTATDANLHPGHKVKLVDHTYGLNTGSTHRCIVSSVSRSGLSMSAELECGSAGSTGTITHGVDKVCGDDHLDTNLDDGYVPLDPLYPPLDEGEGLDLGYLWDTPGPGFTVGGELEEGECNEPSTPLACDTIAWSSGHSIDSGFDWELNGHLTLNVDTESLAIGVNTDDGYYRFRIAGGEFYDPLVGVFKYELLGPTTNHRLPGYSRVGDLIVWKLEWNDILKRLIFYAEVADDICYLDFIIEPSATMGSAVTWETVTGSPTRASEFIDENCSPGSAGADELGPLGRSWSCGITTLDASTAWTPSSGTIIDRDA